VKETQASYLQQRDQQAAVEDMPAILHMED
jgi:hypothetical protein